MKNPMTLAGIEPATFRFVAQHTCVYVVRNWGFRIRISYTEETDTCLVYDTS